MTVEMPMTVEMLHLLLYRRCFHGMMRGLLDVPGPPG